MIPATTQRALELYVNKRISPGGFLYSLLTNDLFGAISKADAANLAAIKDICFYVYNEMPADSWGNYDKVKQWLRVAI